MADSSASADQLISVPKGGGALKGLGEKFSPDLHTGTGNFSVPLAVPPGRNGLQPQLALAYSSGASNGAFGIGWSLNVPGVARLTSRGVPRYRDRGAEDQRDVFVLSGAEDLVEVAPLGASTRRYRPRTEGLFARIERTLTGTADYWTVRTKDGLVSTYGSPDATLDCTVADPAGPSRVFAWRLTETRDPFGNRIAYEYRRDRGSTGRPWDQLFLKRISYVDLDGADQPPFLVSVELVYDDEPAPVGITPATAPLARPDPFSDYRAGFEIRTRLRCKWIVVRTHPARDRSVPVRAYELTYSDEVEDPSGLPLNRVSLLSRIELVGFGDDGRPSREAPPLEFGYTRFTPGQQRFAPLTGAGLPTRSLANVDLALVDLFGDGLPDLLELGDTPRYWRNLGQGLFDHPRSIATAPAGLRLGDPGVQVLDADGDGRADLLVTTSDRAGYFPLDLREGWGDRSWHSYATAPTFNLEDPDVRLVDLTGDGVSDALRSGSRFECYFNDPDAGWSSRNVRHVERRSLDRFPDVALSDPRVHLADLSGDGLQDIVLVHRGRIDYWPNLGHGRWGSRLTVAIPGGLPFELDPKRVILGDVDGDGLADLIYVSDREVTLWVNRCGNAFSDPLVIRGTPPVGLSDVVRVVDLHGTGVAGVLWTRDADSSGRPSHFFLDLTGGLKPYLLARVDNNLGATTEVAYAPSTRFSLRDDASSTTRWRSSLPFPVQVVERVTVSDVFSGGTLTTEYRYHHGCWDGAEREFRGFGMVETLDREAFAYPGRGLLGGGLVPSADPSRSPPLLTRTWFHLGPVEPDGGGLWRDMDYTAEHWSGDPDQLRAFEATDPELRAVRDAQRSLRGSVLRSEVYALDGSSLQERPYTVTEHAYEVREVDPPAAGTPRRRIFFPHEVAERTTQWERGDDPLTRLTLSSAFDEVGQPTRRLAVACPRGWRFCAEAPAAGYLATLTHTHYAAGAATGPYLRDRVARLRTFELTATAGQNLASVASTTEGSAGLRLIAETLHRYDATGDATTGFGAFVGMPSGQLGEYGALVRTETLALTRDQLGVAYGAAVPPYLVAGATFHSSADYPARFVAGLASLAGYVHKAASASSSEGYFVVAASKRYDFHRASGSGRGLLLAERDPLGHETTIVEYDDFHLLPARVRDAAGLETSASYSLRTLAPEEVTDPNGNVTRLAYSPAGVVTDTWSLGKPDAAPDDRRNAGDREKPSVHFEYDLLAFRRSRIAAPARPEPASVRAVRRVFHDSDADDTGETVEAWEYFDGFGRLLQTRVQGEDLRFGDEHFGGGDRVLPTAQSSPPSSTVTARAGVGASVANVTVSGWQRYDNKGRVIEAYEPFWTRGFAYAAPLAAQLGRKTSLFYDPRGQLIRTVSPDGSEQRVIYGIPTDLADPPLSPADSAMFAPTPWEAFTYDANDNAGRTLAADPTAATYRHHWNTPSSIEIDALGRTVRTIARHRDAPATSTAALPPIEQHVTRASYDIQGNLTRTYDVLGRLSFQYFHDLARHTLRADSIDAGRRLAVFDAAGAMIESRDAKGALALRSYDALRRPTCLWARDAAADPVTLRERVIHGDDAAAPGTLAQKRGDNLLGNPWRQDDEAGRVTTPTYDFHGNALASTRAVLSDDFLLASVRAQAGPAYVLTAPRVDWDAAVPPELDPVVFETSSEFDALGRVKWSDYPAAANGERYRLRPGFDRSGALQSVALVGPLDAAGDGVVTPYVEHIAYSAKGQRLLVAYGNGLLTRYAYDPHTSRLARVRTERCAGSATSGYTGAGAPLQDLAYSYDLVGNLLQIADRVQGCGIRNGPRGADALDRVFTYDPLYRLTSATGRECSDLASQRPWSDYVTCGFNQWRQGTANLANAPDMTQAYREEYSYDPAGNMMTLRHGEGAAPAWVRHFGMSGFDPGTWVAKVEAWRRGDAVDWGSDGNRLTNVGDADDAGASHAFDACGNMVREQTERHLEWDHANRLKAFRNQVGAARPSTYALYLYDAGGQRVKKLVVAGARYRTTVYVGSTFEHHAERGLVAVDGIENCLLHVMDNKNRIAISRVGPAFADDGAAEHSVQYHLGDHLGSSGVVVSAAGGWISREEFLPYGESSFGAFARKRFRFGGRERDEESGLYHHDARYFACWLGRWVSCDPLGAVSSVNLFRGLANSPLVTIDPTGTADAGVSTSPDDARLVWPSSAAAPPSSSLLSAAGTESTRPRDKAATRSRTPGQVCSACHGSSAIYATPMDNLLPDPEAMATAETRLLITRYLDASGGEPWSAWRACALSRIEGEFSNPIGARAEHYLLRFALAHDDVKERTTDTKHLDAVYNPFRSAMCALKLCTPDDTIAQWETLGFEEGEKRREERRAMGIRVEAEAMDEKSASTFMQITTALALIYMAQAEAAGTKQYPKSLWANMFALQYLGALMDPSDRAPRAGDAGVSITK